MRARIIHWLGGVTNEEAWDEIDSETEWLNSRIEGLEETIEELQALIPAPKKSPGRPRKITPVKVI
tara:strand:- start:1126 stop:1323 length:198 start_codon:yes stop_codon:yes gene_type:complete